ncbi:MAG: hypothetical protein H7X95_08845 [Deltaproteobacteria bacterium]|nr:hypothetical protein [Deltaproteobacteria bacterium]
MLFPSSGEAARRKRGKASKAVAPAADTQALESAAEEDRKAIEAWNQKHLGGRSSVPAAGRISTAAPAVPASAGETDDAPPQSPSPVPSPTPSSESPADVPLPPPATPPAAFSGTSSGSALWHGNNRDLLQNNDNYAFVLVRHSAMIDAGDTRMSIRIDHENVFRNPSNPGGGQPDRRNSIRMERVTLDVNRNWGPVSVQFTGGDLYAQMGRGLVLALRKYDELGLDFALRGGKVQVGLFDDRITATVLAGFTNINNILPDTEEFLSDPGDRLAAANLEVRPSEGLTLGTHGALVTGGDPLDVNLDGIVERKEDGRTLNYSGSAETLLGSWNLGAEYARQLRRPDLSPVERGSAIFATATGPLGPLTVLAEFKDYREFHQLNALSGRARDRVFYSLAPSAERIDQEITNNTDVTGGRLRADMSLGADGDTVLHASAGMFRYRFDGLNIQHGFGGVRRRLHSGGAVAFVGGYRHGTRIDNGNLELSIFQFEGDAFLPLTSHFSMHANVKPERVIKEAFPAYLRGTSLAELDWKAKVSVGAGLDWTTESAVLMPADRLPTFYPFGIIRVRPSDSLIVQLFVGSQKGGLKCFGGVCRQVPPFAGARLDVTVRF